MRELGSPRSPPVGAFSNSLSRCYLRPGRVKPSLNLILQHHRDVKGDSEPERREGRLTDQKLNLRANWPCLPPLAEVTLPKLKGSLTLEEGPPKICRLKALNISKRNSMFICSRMMVRFMIPKSSL